MADGDQQRLADSSDGADSSFSDTPPGSTEQGCKSPKIHFTRGIILALPETTWSWLQTEVVTPVPGPVVKRLQKYNKQPRDSELVQVCVTNAAASSATINGGAATVTVDLQAQDGDYLSVKKILCWYGTADGIDPDAWELDKRNFRKNMAELKILKPLKEYRSEVGRPAQLLQFGAARFEKLKDKGILFPF